VNIKPYYRVVNFHTSQHQTETLALA